jgi:hypothetical protein
MSDVLKEIEALEAEYFFSHTSPDRTHEFAMKVARAAEIHYRHTLHGYDRGTCEREAAVRYPLPPKKVLREEPVPGTDWPLYRWHPSARTLETAPQGQVWRSAIIPANRLDVMRLAVDLHDNPYREEPQ